MKRKHLVIDTDFGDDPDDILTLLYALKSSEVKILAIITSDEYKTNYRAVVLRKWIKSRNFNIPVFSGLDLNHNNFLLEKEYNFDVEVNSIYQTRKIGEVLKLLAKSDGFYLSIGGLSNISFLHNKFKNLLEKIRVIIMAGAINYIVKGKAEHNINLDLKSSEEIFSSNLDIKWVFSDQTFTKELEISEKHKLFNMINKQKGYFYNLIKFNLVQFYKKKYPKSYLHDPITFSSIFLNSIKFKKRKLKILKNGTFKFDIKGKETNLNLNLNYKIFWKDFNKKLKADFQNYE